MAGQLGIARNSLLYWIEHGVVRARKESGGWQRWIVWADAQELERLQGDRDRDIAAEHRRRWTAVPSLDYSPSTLKEASLLVMVELFSRLTKPRRLSCPILSHPRSWRPSTVDG